MATPNAPDGGKMTAFQPGLIERVAGALRYTFTGKGPDWFGPNMPMTPQAPEGVRGRPLDFPVGVNLSYQPRSEATEQTMLGPEPFKTLRRAADPAQGGPDLLRLAIETRKDQMEAQKWTIRGRDRKDGGQRAKDLVVALRRPDLVHTYNQWARQIWEDMLVTDTSCVYLRPVPGYGFKLPEVMDGTMLKRLVDSNGRTPLPPEPAFQAVLKGLPAVDYSLDEIIYMPRNLRSYRFYGMSPVEQVVNTVILALKRQQSLTAYHTDGNVPDHLVGVPETWNPDQIQQAQDWLDSILEGNVKARRKLIFIPGGMQPLPLKDPKLQDPVDEWLARIICWCFSLPPSALVKEVNRATAETAKESGQQEGLEPLKMWWKAFMDDVILRCWGAEDLEFAYEDEEIADPKTKMEYWTGFVTAKVVTADEARQKALGMEPLTPEQKEELNPPPPPGLGGPEMGGPGEPEKGPGQPQGAAGGKDSAPSKTLPPASSEEGEKTEKLEKKKRLQPLKRDRPIHARAVRAITKAARKFLDARLSAIREGLEEQTAKLAKMDMDEFAALWNIIRKGRESEVLKEKLAEVLQDLMEDGGAQAVAQVIEFIPGGSAADIDAMLSQVNERALAWAEDRAAELMTAIDETTRDGIRDLVGKAIEEGWSNDQLSDALGESNEFSDYRCDMIARTETQFANIQGNLEGYAASGVVQGKEWSTGKDEVCDDCNALEGMVVGLDGAFPGGDPPLHPNCRCDVLPVLMDRNEE